MRITLDIDDEVLEAVKERARRERTSVGRVISRLAKRALSAPALVPPPGEPEAVCGFRPLPSRGGVVTNELIARLGASDMC